MGGGGGGVDVSEGANLSGAGDDGRGLGGGGTGWWVRYRFPWVCKELWKDLPDSLQFLISFLNFNIHCNVFLVILEWRSSKCGLRCSLKNVWQVIVCFGKGCLGSVRREHEVMLMGLVSLVHEGGLLS